MPGRKPLPEGKKKKMIRLYIESDIVNHYDGVEVMKEQLERYVKLCHDRNVDLIPQVGDFGDSQLGQSSE